MGFKKQAPTPSRGIVQAIRPRPKTFVNAIAFNQPSSVLTRLDKIIRPDAHPDICVVRSQGGIGDVLMTLPTVKAIAQKYNILVDYATDFDYLDGALPKVVQGVPYIKRIIPYKDVASDLYDAILDLTCPCVSHEVAHAPPVSRIDLFARHAGLTLQDHHIDYYHTNEELERAKTFLEEKYLIGMRPYKLILVNPSSSTSRRDVPLQVIPRLLRDLLLKNKDAKALVFTHYTDNAEAKAISWGEIPGVIQMRDYGIRDIAAYMHYCEMVICPDSALLHMAGALDKKTVAFFGPTDPRARINHYPKAIAIWPGNGLSCAPCWYQACNAGFVCWKRLDYSVALTALHAVLNGNIMEQHPDILHSQAPGGGVGNYEVL